MVTLCYAIVTVLSYNNIEYVLRSENKNEKQLQKETGGDFNKTIRKPLGKVSILSHLLS